MRSGRNDGQLRITLRGDDIVPRFLEILNDYVAQRYPELAPEGPISGAAPTRRSARR